MVDGIAGLGRSMKDTEGYETCGGIGIEKETDLKGHDDVRENQCDQIIPVIRRFAFEDVCRKKDQQGKGEGTDR